ncbi:MAG: sulfurtransferase-like selenium metabolism protein YedF [Syntrophorhabdaceae bacterium]|nr:sulfurtransferase-like selenium metabolism protein YedF [Syntrophorhabdaceae bacterium]
MAEIIDARGLACPQPVLLTKKALETKKDIIVLVDNETALENVKRFAINSGCHVSVIEETGDLFSINIIKPQGVELKEIGQEEIACTIEKKPPSEGPTVIVMASNTMGSGDDELGTVLLRSFVHTLTEMEKRPDVIILYNSGVKLAIEGSDVLHDLKRLEEVGVKILVCGTCLNFFNVKEHLRAGVVSNMYDITDTLLKAERIVKP